MFFILSGFVLSQPWLKGNPAPYPVFAIRRVCRIWLPYLAALALALAVGREITDKHTIAVSGLWMGVQSTTDVIGAFSLIGYFNADVINGAFWSLVHEMRISLIFPVLMLTAKKPWRPVLAGAFLASLLSGIGRKIIQPQHSTDILNTVHFGAIFICGLLLARHQEELTRATRMHGRLFAVAGILLYSYGRWCFPGYHPIHLPHIEDWSCVAGSSIFILLALGFRPWALRCGPALWLGRVSYSLYLIHVPILLLMTAYFPVTIGVLLAIPASLLLADLMYRWVEVQAIALGSSCADLLKQKSRSPLLETGPLL